MSTARLDATPGAGRDGVTTVRVVRSEWIKFATLRSTWSILAGAVVTMVALGLTIAATLSIEDDGPVPADVTASAALQGLVLAQLLTGVLGVMFVTSEYGSGMIRATFAAVPRRGLVVGAKAAVLGAVVLVATGAASLVTYLGAVPLLPATEGSGVSLGDPGVIRVVAGTGVYLAVVAVLGGALGWLLRSGAAAIGALLGVLVIVPLVIALLPAGVGDTIGPYLPSAAGQAFASGVEEGSDMLGPWAGLGVFLLWAAAGLAAALLTVRRRDA
jgi:ABC-type transport system involved in multi-copper enzyme maturation permease subunit